MSFDRKNIGFVAQRGFSLLEVLVAMSILALSIGVLMRSFGDFSRSAAVSGEYRQALMIAESRLAYAVATKNYDGSGVDAERFSWSLNLSPVADDGTAVPARYMPSIVEIEVSWHNGERTHDLSLSTVQLGAAGRNGGL